MILGTVQVPVLIAAGAAALVGAFAVLPSGELHGGPARGAPLPELPDLAWAVRQPAESASLVAPPFARPAPVGAPEEAVERPARDEAVRKGGLVLRGVFIAGAAPTALIAEGDEEPRWIAIGDRIGELEVVAIGSRHVQLAGDGGGRLLSFPHHKKGSE